MTTPIEVVKVGGSLLERPHFADTLRQWLAESQQAAPTHHWVLLVGGGRRVQELRCQDRQQPGPVADVHWKAIELMELSGRQVARALAHLPVVDTWPILAARCGHPGASLFLATHFLRHTEPQLAGLRLPCGWEVTSDSIAARMALLLPAARLTLLKSIPPPQPLGPDRWQELAEQGYVDPFFPQLASQVLKIVALSFPRTLFNNPQRPCHR